MNPIVRTIMTLISLGLIGLGAWFLYWPLAPLAIGGLLWYDLSADARAAMPDHK